MRSPSLQDQADFIRSLLARTRLADGSTAAETWMLLDGFAVSELAHIAKRLERMAPHEGQIRKMVTKK